MLLKTVTPSGPKGHVLVAGDHAEADHLRGDRNVRRCRHRVRRARGVRLDRVPDVRGVAVVQMEVHEVARALDLAVGESSVI